MRITVAGLLCVFMSVCFCACQTEQEGSVMNKVLSDFGLKGKPEGYVSGTDRVFESLSTVGATEMKRLNLAEQHGKVKFQQDAELRGKYYKEVKVYEAYFPSDVKPVSGTHEATGYVGYIDYEYRIYQSMRKESAALAEGETADIPTDVTGREKFRYSFGSTGDWSGGKGERVKN